MLNLGENNFMEYRYVLKIMSEKDIKNSVSSILGIESNYKFSGWGYEIIEKEEDDYFDFISTFLDLLKGKYEELSKLGIQKEDITIWMIYRYNGQCNMEFDPISMKRLGDNGIKLCISCYEVEE